MRNFLIFCTVLLSVQLHMFAQEPTIEVTGTITESGTATPIPGVNILEKGTSNGVMTDFDGNYSIEVPANATLVVSYIGFGTQEIEVSGRTSIAIQMEIEAAALDEVVVVGYGTQKKVNLTGAVSSVDGEALNRRPVTNSASMLQGQVPGLRVVQNSGEPGNEGLNVRIRGQGTFSGAGSNP